VTRIMISETPVRNCGGVRLPPGRTGAFQHNPGIDLHLAAFWWAVVLPNRGFYPKISLFLG
jgi:hypothetical protein